MLDIRMPLPDREFAQRSLDENRFWLRIMKEHSLFLSEGFLRRDVNLIRVANTFFRDFDALLRTARGIGPVPAPVRDLNERAIALTTDLRNFKQEVLFQILTGRIQGQFNLPLLVDHIRREAEYFITVLTRLNEGVDEPVEAAIVAAADQFSDQFDTLLAQARDLESIIERFSPVLVFVGGHTLDRPTIIRLQEAEQRRLAGTPPVQVRFNSEAQAAAREIRDFKRQATQLVQDVRALSIINPLLADHVTREAEKFLQVLNMLEARVNQPRAARFAEARVVSRPTPPCPDDGAENSGPN